MDQTVQGPSGVISLTNCLSDHRMSGSEPRSLHLLWMVQVEQRRIQYRQLLT